MPVSTAVLGLLTFAIVWAIPIGGSRRMKRYWWPLIVVACSLAHADSACKVSFAVVWKDSLNNVKQGLREQDRQWLQTKMSKKYPELCYDSGAPPVALWINIGDATYHSTKTVTDTDSHTAPLQGQITDSSPGSPTYGQQIGTIEGTATTTTTNTREVPYSFDYHVMIMSLEVRQKDGSWKVMHNFRHDTIQRQWYGIAISNRHPNQQLIDSALKWMHDGGLTDPTQTMANH